MRKALKEATPIVPPTKLSKTTDDTRYYAAKQKVKDYEKNNYDKIYLFRSRGQDPQDTEWYKTGGNSALFYKYLIAGRLKREVHIHPDNEWKDQFKHGLASVRFLEKLNASLIKLGYAPYETIDKDLSIVAFKLKKTYTKQEVQEFKDLEAKCFDSIRTIAVPRNMNPVLYNTILNLNRQLPSKIRTMDPTYKNLYGLEIAEQAKQALQVYAKLIRNLIKSPTAKKQLKESATIMSINILIIAENGYWGEEQVSKIGNLIGELNIAIDKAFATKTTNGTTTNQTQSKQTSLF
ncbi:hypothetical protein IKF40_02055 [Candidatus Saccharibacteria bacterium]|nr:hypothetical protein [Candidatus Saccharibacteria bacterium]